MTAVERGLHVRFVPASTGADRGAGAVFQDLGGRLQGIASGLPVPGASVPDLFFALERATTIDAVRESMSEATATPRPCPILLFGVESVGPSDLIGNLRPSTFGALFAQVMGGHLLNARNRRDDQWICSTRARDLVASMTSPTSGRP